MQYFSKTVICLVIQLCAHHVFAQDPEQIERFKLFDTNNDNQISAAEAKNTKWFKAADKDRNGIVTLEEGQAFLTSRGGSTAKQPAPKPEETDTAIAKPSISKPSISKTEFRYHETPGVEANLESLDLYLPSKAKNSPVLVYIHGGGWQRGDKKAVESKATFYGSQGWIVASVNYRLVPDGKHPNNVQDVANAIAWVHTHAAEHGGDPERIFVMGHSAGAHLAALVATGEKWLEKAGKSLSIVKGVVELDTQALDVVRMIREANTPLYQQAFGHDEAALHDASPMEHVSKGKSIPPFLLVVAGGVRAKNAQANSFQEKLRAADVPCDFIQAPEHDHGSLNRAMGVVGDKTHEAVWKFLCELSSSQLMTSPINEDEPGIGMAQQAQLLAAVATADITPPVGYRHGGGYNEVISTGVHDPLYAKVMVLRQAKESFVLVECDLLSVPLAISSKIRKAASIETNIPVSNIVIAATHNHGSPEYWGPLRDVFHERDVSQAGKDTRESIDYPQVLVSRIVGAITSASNTCKPVTADLTVARQEGLAFNRRFHMTDGSVLFNPGKMNKAIVRPAGPVDEDLPFLLFRDATDGTPRFSFCTFAMHTAVFGGTEFGADFPGHLQLALQAKFGKEFVSLFGEGCAGDVNHIDFRSDQPQPSSSEPIRVASTLSKTIETNRENAWKIDLCSLKSKSRSVQVGIVAASEIKLEQSKSLLLNQSSSGARFLDLVDAWRSWHASHERSEHGDSKPLEVQALRFSRDLAIVFLPHEVFVELGMAIKSSSPFRNTIVVSLANDVDYYIPTRKAFEEGSYEVTTCPLAPGCGEKLVSLAIDLLNELKLSHE